MAAPAVSSGQEDGYCNSPRKSAGDQKSLYLGAFDQSTSLAPTEELKGSIARPSAKSQLNPNIATSLWNDSHGR